MMDGWIGLQMKIWLDGYMDETLDEYVNEKIHEEGIKDEEWVDGGWMNGCRRLDGFVVGGWVYIHMD